MQRTLEDSTLSPDRHPAVPPPSACLVLVLECDHLLRPAARHRLAGLDRVEIGRGADRTTTRAPRDGVRLLELHVADERMSQRHARLERGPGGWEIEDLGSRNGTLVNGARVGRTSLHDGDLVELGRTFFRFRGALPGEPDAPDDLTVAADAALPGLATLHPGLGQDLRQLVRVAASSLPILLLGESGTGKEVVARAAHRLSGRRGPFVAVNCGAIPATLIEAELFGAKRGAYSGAVEDRPGHVRSADGGTLLLDEIGDLPLPAQAAFLRVLQEREVVPVGASHPVPVDFRPISATHRDLAALVADGRFRADLYARLTGFTLRLPPLRERIDDLGLLCAAILRRTTADGGASTRLSPEAARALLRRRWPLNVRELERCLATAVVLAAGDTLRPEHLPPALTVDAAPDAAPPDDEDAELRARLVDLLDRHQGNVSAVARALGKDRVQVHRWARRFGLDLAAWRALP